MRKASSDHDFVIVDTPPKVDTDLRPALRESALVLVPVATSQVDLWATEACSIWRGARGRGHGRAEPGFRAGAADGEIVSRCRNLSAAGTVIGNRVIYAETLGRGAGVVEERLSGPAADEIRALWREIVTSLEIE